MPTHHFDTDDAMVYGVDAAVILYNLKFWLDKNKANLQNIHDGRVWTYNKLDAWCELFPYYSRRQIERILNNLQKAGILLKGNYSSNKFDKTVWYSLNLPKYALEAPESSISPNGEIDNTERGNRCHQTVKCLQIKNKQISKLVNSRAGSADRSGKIMEAVMAEFLSANLPEGKYRYAELKILEYLERFPASESVADCYGYVLQALTHQYGLTGV